MWSRYNCPYCDQARALLKSKGYEIEERKIGDGFTKEELQFYSKNGEFFIEGKPKVNSEKSYIIKNFIPQPFKYSTIIPKDCDVDGIRFIDGVLYIKLLVLSKDSSQYKEYSIE